MKNEPKFQEVYDEFHAKILRYLERMVGKTEAPDLAQEVFIKVDNALKDFKGQSSLSTWIYRIATNTALDKLRSASFKHDKHKISLSGDDSETPDEIAPLQQESLSAQRRAIRTEMNECIREFVNKLPPDHRAVIVLSELKELKNQDIAEVLGVSLDTVKIRLHRARAKLKAIFQAGCDFYSDKEGELACDRKKSEKKPQ